MVNDLIDQLTSIKEAASHQSGSSDELINDLSKICNHKFNLNKIYSITGVISNRNATNLLNDNILAAERQHDLADAESYREQKRSLNTPAQYFIEAVHGCHIAPTIRPISYHDIISIINLALNVLKSK